MKSKLFILLFVQLLATSSFEIQSVESEFPYQFNNPQRAFKILQQVETYEPIPDLKHGNITLINVNVSRFHYGLKIDDDYCLKQRQHFVTNPQKLGGNVTIYENWSKNSFGFKQVFPRIGTLTHPNISQHMPKELFDSRSISLSPRINIFFDRGEMYNAMHMGKHFGCLYQEYGLIPGTRALDQKDLAAISIQKYAKQYRKRPQCFDIETFMPKTWLLDDPVQCRKFFKIINSKKYQRQKKSQGIVYIVKRIDLHGGEGIFPLNSTNEKNLKKEYNDGEICSNHNYKLLIAQKYIEPLLLMDRKFDMRAYMLVASTNPYITYYHEGFIKLSIPPYKKHGKKKEIFAANTAQSQKYLDKAKAGELVFGMNYEQLNDLQLWDFERMQTYLLENEVITDPNWLENYLFPKIKKAMIHLTRATQWGTQSRSQVYQYWGIDFMMDEKLNLYFVEANTDPKLEPNNEKKAETFKKLLNGIFDIQLGYLRSRLKRVIQFVNKIEDEIQASGSTLSMYMEDNLDKLKSEFNSITKNYFEPEFKPAPWNSFKLVMDENIEDVNGRYIGLIPEECFYEEQAEEVEEAVNEAITEDEEKIVDQDL